MEFDPDRVRKNASLAETADLLERVTIQRDELEPEALAIIMQELLSRNIRPEAVVNFECLRSQAIYDSNGNPRLCRYCRRPAIFTQKGWFKLFRFVPIFPITEYCCAAHTRRIDETAAEPE